MEKRRLSGGQIVTIVVAICAAVVLAPVGVMAATGQLVNIADPVTGGNQARVNSAGSLYTAQVDPSTRSVGRVDGGKVRVGDGSGNLTVDGAVLARDMDPNKVLYKSPAGGLTCGASGSGIQVATLDVSRYSRLRFVVRSGAGYQTIIHLRARANGEVIAVPVFEWTVPAGQFATTVFYEPPTQVDMIVFFCNQAQIFVYGIQ
ncbi:MAG TPA: hypothetical protein VGX28_14390 [Frankiaceae bacterium]|jgi:hypothetical protein|nr:hypothetical protein [Frankiaceae bacterium]